MDARGRGQGRGRGRGRGRRRAGPPTMADVFNLLQQVMQNNAQRGTNEEYEEVGYEEPVQELEAPNAAVPPVAAPVEPAAAQNLGQDFVIYSALFQKYGPTKFRGDANSDAAEEWLNQTEKYFEGFRCPEEFKLDIATITLEGEAHYWYEHFKRRMTALDRQITWETFVEEYKLKYLGRAFRMRKTAEFNELKQGDMTVDAYEARFTTLLRHVPEIERSAEALVERFRYGLRYDIRRHTVGVNEYMAIVHRAQDIEWDIERSAKEREALRATKVPQGHTLTSKTVPGKKDKKRKFQEMANPRNDGACNACGRKHGNAPCWGVGPVCYNCGELGHKKNACPKIVRSKFRR